MRNKGVANEIVPCLGLYAGNLPLLDRLRQPQPQCRSRVAAPSVNLSLACQKAKSDVALANAAAAKANADLQKASADSAHQSTLALGQKETATSRFSTIEFAGILRSAVSAQPRRMRLG